MKATNNNKKEVLLEANNLRVSFRTINGTVKAVRGIDFKLYKGRTLGIVGESGSGKSVTSRAVMGILAGNRIIEDGQILYNGMDLLSLSEEDFCKLRGRKISMIFQDPLSSLNPIMRIGNQLTETMFLKERSTIKEAKQNIKIFVNQFQKENDKKVVKELFERYSSCYFDEAEFKRVNDAFAALKSRLELSLNTIIVNEQAYKHSTFKNELKEVKFLINDCNNRLQKENKFSDTKIESLNNEEAYKLFDSLMIKRLEPSHSLSDSIKYLNRVSDITPNKKTISTIVKFLQEVFNVYIKTVEKAAKGNKLVYRYTLTLEDKKSYNEIFNNALKGEKERYSKAIVNCLNKLKEVDKEFFKNLNEFKANEFKKVLPLIDKLSNEAVYLFSSEKDTKVLILPNSLKVLFENYKELVKQEHKQQVLLRRAERRNKTTEVSKTSFTAQERAFMSEIDNGSVSQLNKMKVLIENAIEHLEAQQKVPFDVEEKLEVAKKFLEDSYKNSLRYINIVRANMRAVALMREVGISEPHKRLKQYPFEFSGGMRQRIVIAIALSSDPEILICDEPTTALDVTIQSQILELITKLKKEKDLSIIFITHDLGVIANMADDIAVMYAGKIVEYGTCDDIFYNPRHPYTWALLASMPDLNTKEKLDAIVGTPPNMILPPKGDAFAARNKYALNIDLEEFPPMFKVSDSHYAATWLLDERAPEAIPPKVVLARIEAAYNDMKKNKTLSGPILDNPFISQNKGGKK